MGYGWLQLDQEVLCSLICCSKELTSLIHEQCAGRVSVCMRCKAPKIDDSTVVHELIQHLAEDSRLMASWLTKHRCLLSDLAICHAVPAPQLSVASQNASEQLSETGLASALMAAVKLMLGLSAWTSPSIPTHCLRLAGSALTKLEWTIASRCDARQFSRVAPSLQQLQSLGLRCISDEVGAADFQGLAADALQPLTKLTRLELQHFTTSTAGMQLLPDCLLQLTIHDAQAPGGASWSHRDVIQLQHLTNLQQLQLSSLQGCDVLPRSLTALHTGRCSAMHLAPLTRLQRLCIDGDIPDTALLQLLQMTQCTDLQLTGCEGRWLTAGGFRYLSELPLTRLHLHCELPEGVLPLLGQWTQLTSLRLQVNAAKAGSQQQLAEQLKHLHALQDLSLELQAARSTYEVTSAASVIIGEEAALLWEAEDAQAGGAPFTAAASSALVDALASLPSLQALQVQGLQRDAQAAAELQRVLIT